MPQGFEIRLATIADAPTIGSQRARMFREMGLVPETLFDDYRSLCETRLREQLASGEYIGWQVYPNESPNQLVAGAGVQLRRVLPHPVGEPSGAITIADGRHA